MEKVVPVLPIGEYAAAVAFYVDGLGFEIDFEHRHEPGFPVFMGVRCGALYLHLSEHARGHPGSEVYVFVDDVAAWARRCQEGGLVPVEPPTQRPWGNTEMVLRDPFANTLRFSQLGTHDGVSTPNRSDEPPAGQA